MRVVGVVVTLPLVSIQAVMRCASSYSKTVAVPLVPVTEVRLPSWGMARLHSLARWGLARGRPLGRSVERGAPDPLEHRVAALDDRDVVEDLAVQFGP